MPRTTTVESPGCPVVGGSRENRWTCVCSNGGFPKLVGDDNDNNWTLSELEPSKKYISSKVVLIVLLLCIVIMALVFVALVLWFVNWKDQHPMQWTSPSSDRLTSYSSATNLMSRGFSTVPVYKDYLDCSAKRYIGCIPKTPSLFRSRRGAIQGIIIQFSYSELESVTNRFSEDNLIGIGGNSHVYRGNLRDGRIVAIKRMKTQSGPRCRAHFLV
ncbi:hypothetical protein CASFOL_028828 [Castilleja foliolosa]|uniref:Uncharacterized protein n=1 Tax=Castilleja foliolosa TaxID=1961234 RepID=A0ABD3CC84_9LAMI